MSSLQITKTAHSSRLATVGGFVAILLWSMTVAVVRSLSEDLGPVTAGAAVYGVSGVVALVSLLRCSHRRRLVLQLSPRYLVG